MAVACWDHDLKVGGFPSRLDFETGELCNLAFTFVEEYRSGRNGPDSKSGCQVKSLARGFESHLLRSGEVSEWLKEHAWKACVRVTVPRVRIPPSPPLEASVTHNSQLTTTTHNSVPVAVKTSVTARAEQDHSGKSLPRSRFRLRRIASRLIRRLARILRSLKRQRESD